MNTRDKIAAILDHPQCWGGIDADQIKRLTETDLKHIGDGMIDGKTIQYHDCNWFTPKGTIGFTELHSYYRLEQPQVYHVGDTTLYEAPIVDEPEEGANVFWWNHELKKSVAFNYSTSNNSCRIVFYAGLLFASEAGALAHHRLQQANEGFRDAE